MKKNILSIVFGLIVSFVLILIGEIISQVIYHRPAGFDNKNTEAVKIYVENAPAIVFIVLIISYAMGSIIGGLVSSIIAPHNKMTKSITVGGILMGLGAYNLFMVPHPIWTIVISFFVLIPCSYLGGYLGIRISAKRIRN